MAKFLSGREPKLNIGVSSSTENNTVLQVIGKVGIGTTDARNYALYVNGDANIGGNFNVSGILTAQRLYSTLYGEFTG